MKHSKHALWAGLAASALLLTAPVQAQTQSARFAIPFAFVAGGQTLPAGEYEATLDGGPRLVLWNTSQANTIAVTLSGKYVERSAATDELAGLRFNRYDGTMVLTAAFRPGHEEGRPVVQSKQMSEAIRMNAGAGSAAAVDIRATLK